MQRLHEEDLSGVLIKKGNWDVLNLPAIAENDEEIKIGNFYKKRLKGEVLFEKREKTCMPRKKAVLLSLVK